MNERRQIIPGDIYRHFKNRLYQIISVAYHSETGEKYVVYQALYGDFRTYVRPYDMFVSEVDRNKYPETKQQYRFERVILDGKDKNEEGGETKAHICSEENIQPVPSGQLPEDAPDESSAAEGQVNPYLLMFFDKEGSREQIEYLNSIRSKIDDRLVNDIAVSLDLTVDDGRLDDRIDSLINCLRTKARFECERFR